MWCTKFKVFGSNSMALRQLEVNLLELVPPPPPPPPVTPSLIELSQGQLNSDQLQPLHIILDQCRAADYGHD